MCRLECNKAFGQAWKLRRHHLTHSGEKVHKCAYDEVCEKSFSQAGSLKKHLKTHSGEKAFKCPQCPKSFAKETFLTAHLFLAEDHLVMLDWI